MIKNIVFDLGGVILKDTPDSILENFNFTDRENEFIKEKFFDDFSKLDFGQETLEEHFDNSGLDEKYRDLLVNYYKHREFNEDVIEFINKLHEKEYKIYILSNNNRETYNYLRENLINIDGWVISSLYHVCKPSKEIYEVLFKQYNLNPNECFFIDNSKSNIFSGKSFGMDGYVFDHKNGLVELYKKFDIWE